MIEQMEPCWPLKIPSVVIFMVSLSYDGSFNDYSFNSLLNQKNGGVTWEKGRGLYVNNKV